MFSSPAHRGVWIHKQMLTGAESDGLIYTHALISLSADLTLLLYRPEVRNAIYHVTMRGVLLLCGWVVGGRREALVRSLVLFMRLG